MINELRRVLLDRVAREVDERHRLTIFCLTGNWPISLTQLRTAETDT